MKDLRPGQKGWHRQEWSGQDADGFEVDSGGRRGGFHAGKRRPVAGPTDDPCRMDHSGRGVEILDDAAAFGVSRYRQDLQYRMDAIPGYRADDPGACRGCARLRDPGAAVARQWCGWWQSKGLYRGAALVRKTRRLFVLLVSQR